jgi:class 3 adenylate cyclase
VSRPRGLSFRTRLLLALIGAVAPILIVALLVVDAQTRSVTRDFTRTTSQRTDAAFEQLQSTHRRQLAALGTRFAGSNRFPALLFEEPDLQHLAQDVNYELELTSEAATLVAFADIEGKPVAAILQGNALSDPAVAVPAPLMNAVIARADTSAFGYQLVREGLYDVHVRLLRLVNEPVGFVVLGTPINDALAQDLRPAGGGHVCFAAGGRCVASTLSDTVALRESQMVAPGADRLEIDGQSWSIISSALPGGASDIRRIIAIPLGDVLRPFNRIQWALRLAGIGALLIGLGLALVLARGLSRPIRSLVRATESVARGDYTVHIETTSTDEIGTLADSFNHMTEGLRLKEQYRGLLDKVVSPEIAAEMMRGEIMLGGETREVTTLFADLRGFTAMTEGMDPRQVIAILNQVMEQASNAVEAEGGVVDKYVGDEIMALFGAPIARPDDPARAVRAAIRIRDAIGTIAEGRAARGERTLGVGIGINTGEAVAGNMGSPRRLNYTVLGESVNIASRLCSQAKPQEILMSEETYLRVQHDFNIDAAGERQLKGISRAYPVFAVRDGAGAQIPRPSTTFGWIAAALLAGLSAAPLPAQRTVQLDLSARLEVAGYFTGNDPAWLIPSTTNFVAPRASLFADLFVGARLYALVELRADRGPIPADTPFEFRAEQYFLRFSPTSADLHLQAGRFVSPFGEYPQRHHTTADPFIRPPYHYEYRTTLMPDSIAPNVNVFLTWKDDNASFRKSEGAPIIWGIPYQLGAMVLGGRGPISFRAAVMNSAPASRTYDWKRVQNLTERPSLVGSLGVRLTPEFELGGSFSRGPWMSTHLPATLDTFPIDANSSQNRDDYLQQIWALNAAFSRGRLQTRAEVVADRKDAPNIPESLNTFAYSIEGAWRFSMGLDVAARWGAMQFSDIDSSLYGQEPWDYDVRRLQLAAGYRIDASKDVRVEYMLNRSDRPTRLDANLISVRAAWMIDRLW